MIKRIYTNIYIGPVDSFQALSVERNLLKRIHINLELDVSFCVFEKASVANYHSELASRIMFVHNMLPVESGSGAEFLWNLHK